MVNASDAPLSARLKEKARELGFALSGIAPATDADGFPRFRDWLARGYAGEMSYLHTQGEARRNPDSILETVRSVLMVGMEYGPRPTPQPPPCREGVTARDASSTSDEAQEAEPEFTPSLQG